jgi:NAD(P)-dependent dehydrogenase (short-subunit alcohol dehydrogenase family)
MGELEKESSAPFVKRGALGRMGEPVEIARLMAFVAGPDASYLTGTDILCDGGTMAAF